MHMYIACIRYKWTGLLTIDGKDLPVCACVYGSAHDCGCVVDGSNAMVA